MDPLTFLICWSISLKCLILWCLILLESTLSTNNRFLRTSHIFMILSFMMSIPKILLIIRRILSFLKSWLSSSSLYRKIHSNSILIIKIKTRIKFGLSSSWKPNKTIIISCWESLIIFFHSLNSMHQILELIKCLIFKLTFKYLTKRIMISIRNSL